MDKGITPGIKVMTTFLLITSILVVIARGTTKTVIVRSANLDDILIALSLVSTTCDSHHESPCRQLIRARNLVFQYWSISGRVRSD